MSITITITLMVIAGILLVVEALKITNAKVSFGWLGLACWALAIILTGK